MRVKELANYLSVSAETVRFYTRQGFLSPTKNPVNGYKEYGVKDQSRLRFILSARALGFTVKDIAEILSVAEQKRTPCPMVRMMIEKRLLETEAQYQETVKLRQRMRDAVKTWSGLPDAEPTGDMICHLIESFSHSQEGVHHE